MSITKLVEYTAFGQTLKVQADLHNMTAEETPEDFLWVERGEDYYALMSPQLKNKKVAIVRREAWLSARADKE